MHLGFVFCLWEALWCPLKDEGPTQHVCDLHGLFDAITAEESKQKLSGKRTNFRPVWAYMQNMKCQELFIFYSPSYFLPELVVSVFVSMSQSHGKLSGQLVSLIGPCDLFPSVRRRRACCWVWFFISGCVSFCGWIGGGQLCYPMWPQGDIQLMLSFQWIWWQSM